MPPGRLRVRRVVSRPLVLLCLVTSTDGQTTLLVGTRPTTTARYSGPRVDGEVVTGTGTRVFDLLDKSRGLNVRNGSTRDLRGFSERLGPKNRICRF